MKLSRTIQRMLALVMAITIVAGMIPVNANAASMEQLQASLDKAKTYIDGITVNNSSNDPATVVKTFKKHFTWDNEKRENSKSYLFDWSYYNGVVFEGLEYVYEVTGESVYRDYVVEYMSSLIDSNGTWAKCTNSGYTSKQCAGYNNTHGADCYMTAALLMDAYQMTGDNRYLTMAKTLYTDLDNAAAKYSLSKAGNNYRHTWASDPSPDLWLDGLYMILPFRAEYAKYIGDTAELDLIVSRMQWVSDNMYNSSRKLFYHAADSATSNSGTFWLRSIGWYAAAIVDIMDSMSGANLETMKAQLVKLVDGMKACQNASNGMWLNNMAASQSSSNPYETSGTALVCYAVMKAVNNGWLDKSYADMAVLAFNGICNEKLSGSTLKDICFKGAPGSSNSTFYNNEGKGVGPFIMFYAEMLEYVNNNSCDHHYEAVTQEATCVEGGSVVYTCEHCGDSYSEEIPATGIHTYKTVTVDATCTADGSVTTACTVCGDQTTEVIPAAGHKYECVETAATCGKDGSKVYTCSVCGDTYTEVIIATGMHLNEIHTENATCAKDGSVTTICTVCNATSVEVIPATGKHTYEVVTVEPTCVTKGSVTYTCGVCGYSYAETIPATGNHVYKAETVEATCTEDGRITYTCAFCADSYKETIKAPGHSYTCEVTEATCTKAGVREYTCTVCGHDYSEEIAAIGHNYTGVATNATCLQGGFTTYTCQNCGDSYVADETEALGHRYETATVEPTCTKAGSVTYYCVCGDSYSESIPATGHTYKTVVTDPTCIKGGYTTHTCSACGDSYVTDQMDALGHDYDTSVVKPTCTKGGYTSSTCRVCGEGKIYDETDALGHDYKSVTVDPTETEGGYTTHTCIVCGHSYTDNYVDALGHTIVSVVTDPTCESKGYTTHTCIVCGEVTVDTYVPALGHNYQTVTVDATCTADGSVSGSCTTCGDFYEKVIGAYGHSYTAAVTAPTCTKDGYTVYSCGRCGDNYVADQTEALGHNYSAIITNVTCTKDGYTTYLCVACGDSYVGDTVAAPGHIYETVTAEATCSEDGSHTYTCTVCGDSYSEVIPATGHNYKSVITEATCTENGYTTHICDCGQSYVDNTVPALGHSYESEEVNGNLVYTCEHCSDSYTVTVGWVAMPGSYVLDTDGIDIGAEHKYIVVGADKDYALTLSGSTIGASKVTVNNNAIALDDAAKYEFYFVNNSGKEKNSYLLTQNGSKGVYHMGGNMYYGTDNKGYWHIGSASNGKYQLYDFDNLNWYLNYGYVWASDSVSRFAVSSNARSVRLFKATDSYARLYGVLNQVWAHGADVTESAILSKVQIQTSADGITADASAAVDSSLITWDKALDGYTAGTYTATVTYQGQELGTITVEVTGEHTYKSVTKEATCTEAGYITHTCADCGKSYVDGNVAALGHSYSSAEAGNEVIYTCDRCGHSYTESIVSFKKVSSLSANNSYVITLYSGNKYYAVSHAGNKISAVQITVSGDEITSDITADLIWTYSSNKLSYKAGNTTYYLYAQPASGWMSWWSAPTLTISSSNSTTVSFSNSKLKMSNYYLRYSNGSISLNSSATTTNIFVEK